MVALMPGSTIEEFRRGFNPDSKQPRHAEIPGVKRDDDIGTGGNGEFGDKIIVGIMKKGAQSESNPHLRRIGRQIIQESPYVRLGYAQVPQLLLVFQKNRRGNHPVP